MNPTAPSPATPLLLDTNVVSELSRSRPHPAVLAFLASRPPDAAHLSLITIGEIERGIWHLGRADPERAGTLRQWLEGQLRPSFAERVLPLDEQVVRRWGEFMALPAARARSGIAIDALIAATASLYHLTLVTRNAADFQPFPIAVYNPWGFPAAE